jgi:hypothetical protein
MRGERREVIDERREMSFERSETRDERREVRDGRREGDMVDERKNCVLVVKLSHSSPNCSVCFEDSASKILEGE